MKLNFTGPPNPNPNTKNVLSRSKNNGHIERNMTDLLQYTVHAGDNMLSITIMKESYLGWTVCGLCWIIDHMKATFIKVGNACCLTQIIAQIKETF